MKLLNLIIALLALMLSMTVHADTTKVGVVLMHGKGGSPTKHVSGLASSLTRTGALVANIDMPWSGFREYDATVKDAENEVNVAIASLRQKGAEKVFVAGHSQGGLFALYFGGKHPVDGIIAIAPGGNVGSQIYSDKIGQSLEQARSLVKEGKGLEKTQLSDYESSKGVYPISTTPAIYLTWFEPEGAMNQTLAMKSIKPNTPVLYIAPTNDYPALIRIKDIMFGLLPKNASSKLYEPNASHILAPTASSDAISEWMDAVAK